VADAAGLEDPRKWVWLEQVHGAEVVEVASAPPSPPRADAATTSALGVPIAIVTADCAPVVLACRDAFGVVHAGHKGLTSGVIEAAVARVRAIGTGDVRAFLGPCIRAECYEFGAEDLARVVATLGPDVEGRTRAGRPAFDLAAGVRRALARVGVDGIEDCDVCTADSDALFSYRRDGTTGRQVTVAVRR
jgi:polyphenol oxidase